MFGSIDERLEGTGAQKRASRSLVVLRASEGALHVQDTISEEMYRFDEPKGKLIEEKPELSQDGRGSIRLHILLQFVLFFAAFCPFRVPPGVSNECSIASRRVEKSAA